MELIVVGLGPGPQSYVTLGAKEAMKSAEKVFCQTQRHPMFAVLGAWGIQAEPLDALYEQAEDFDDMNRMIAQRVCESATQQRTVFAVTGHGVKGQNAVQLALAYAQQRGIPVRIVAGVAQEEAALAACAQSCEDGVCVHYQRVDAYALDTQKTQVLVDMDSQIKLAEAKIALMGVYPDEQAVVLTQLVGDEIVPRRVALSEIDRLGPYDASTCVVLPPLALEQKAGYSAQDLVEICRILRAPDGCPWDREQTHFSLKKSMMEECCEAVAAIDEGDPEHLSEELGDVFLQVALHAVMGEEEGDFTIFDVYTGICEKMIRRHPHIFGTAVADTAEQVLDRWEEIKKQERGGVESPHVFGELAFGMPALIRAQKIAKKAEKQGIMQRAEQGRACVCALCEALDHDGLTASQRERLGGEVLFATAAWLQVCDVHAETALAETCMEKAQSFDENMLQNYEKLV